MGPIAFPFSGPIQIKFLQQQKNIKKQNKKIIQKGLYCVTHIAVKADK